MPLARPAEALGLRMGAASDTRRQLKRRPGATDLCNPANPCLCLCVPQWLASSLSVQSLATGSACAKCSAAGGSHQQMGGVRGPGLASHESSSAVLHVICEGMLNAKPASRRSPQGSSCTLAVVFAGVATLFALSLAWQQRQLALEEPQTSSEPPLTPAADYPSTSSTAHHSSQIGEPSMHSAGGVSGLQAPGGTVPASSQHPPGRGVQGPAREGASASSAGSAGLAAQLDKGDEKGEMAGRGLGREVEGPLRGDVAKAEAVKQAMLHAWRGYERYAMGAPELHPISKTAKEGIKGGVGISGLGVTVVDALSTLHIMGLSQEADRARHYILHSLDFDTPTPVSFFEATIRLLGGLVAAYDQSGDRAFLSKAEDLGGRLLPSFGEEGGSGLPASIVQLSPRAPPASIRPSGRSTLSSVGSNLLEFGALGVRTGRPQFLARAEAAMRRLHACHPQQGILSKHVDLGSGATVGEEYSVGPEGDSYYEYLLKYWILMGKQDDHWRQRWEAAADDILARMRPRSRHAPDLAMVGALNRRSVEPTLEHLTCFLPGNLALGVMHGAVRGPKAEQYLDFARRMTHACFQLYNITATGLGAESITYDLYTGQPSVTDPAYWQRPEVVESLFYLYRATGEEVYRQWGWQMFTAFERHCRQEAGYAGVRDVNQDPPELEDAQQSWLLAETFKYWYLLFSPPSALSLDHWVLNTEAHPLRVVAGEELPTKHPWLLLMWQRMQQPSTGSGQQPEQQHMGKEAGALGRAGQGGAGRVAWGDVVLDPCPEADVQGGRGGAGTGGGAAGAGTQWETQKRLREARAAAARKRATQQQQQQRVQRGQQAAQP